VRRRRRRRRRRKRDGGRETENGREASSDPQFVTAV
jgi:hypothetical protein